jgi:hypothetical protein
MGLPKGSVKPAGSGRAPGTSNKVTLEARAAIADFVNGNSPRLQEWLDKVANGVPKMGPDNLPVINAHGMTVWQIEPNPEKAFNLFQSVVEYHVPKIARTEVTGANGGPLSMTTIDFTGLSDAELDQVQDLLGKATTGESK